MVLSVTNHKVAIIMAAAKSRKFWMKTADGVWYASRWAMSANAGLYSTARVYSIQL
jgi:hypothetical protein